MSEAKTGGAAYPASPGWFQQGMTLRDRFAIEALRMLSIRENYESVVRVSRDEGVSPAVCVASYVYEIADAMMDARKV